MFFSQSMIKSLQNETIIHKKSNIIIIKAELAPVLQGNSLKLQKE
jgi:hypothetical protein